MLIIILLGFCLGVLLLAMINYFVVTWSINASDEKGPDDIDLTYKRRLGTGIITAFLFLIVTEAFDFLVLSKLENQYLYDMFKHWDSGRKSGAQPDFWLYVFLGAVAGTLLGQWAALKLNPKTIRVPAFFRSSKR